jgi:hypothetical protein
MSEHSPPRSVEENQTQTKNLAAWEHEKWKAEFVLRERELAVKEGELELQRKDSARAGWRSPLVVAVLAAALGAAGNAFVSYINASLERQLEDQKSEQQRILEIIKTGNPDSAAENLQFLLNAGLIAEPSRVTKLREFLKTRAPGSGPSLPSPSSTGPIGGIVGTDDAVPAKTLQPQSALSKVTTAVGQLHLKTKDGFPATCTAFVTGPRTIVTAGHCVKDVISGSLTLKENGRDAMYAIEFPPKKISYDATGALNYAVLSRRGGGIFKNILQLATRPPAVGERLGLVMFRGSAEQLVVNNEDCRVLKVDDNEIHHGCDTGPGSSGAPLVSSDGTVVLGVHVRRASDGGVAVRADRVVTEGGALLHY